MLQINIKKNRLVWCLKKFPRNKTSNKMLNCTYISSRLKSKESYKIYYAFDYLYNVFLSIILEQ